jgi:hypothetical protein
MGEKLSAWRSVLVLLISSSYSFAQQGGSEPDTPMKEISFVSVKMTGSFYKANSLQTLLQHYYLGGNTEVFFSDNFSFRGDFYSLVGSRNEGNYTLRGTSLIFVGFNRHFNRKNWSPFLGAFTGISRLQSQSLLETFTPDLSHASVHYVPALGMLIGLQYNVHPYFYFFTEARLTHQKDPYGTGFMDEISYSAGLGFSILKRD